MKILYLIFIISCTAYTATKYENNFKHGSTPIGYKKIKWGTPEQNMNLRKNSVMNLCNGSRVYFPPKDDFKYIGKVKLKYNYYFYKSKFVGVEFFIENSDDYLYIFNVCSNKFGTDYKGETFNDEIIWRNKKVTVALIYEDYQKPRLIIFLTKFREFQINFEKKREQNEKKRHLIMRKKRYKKQHKTDIKSDTKPTQK